MATTLLTPPFSQTSPALGSLRGHVVSAPGGRRVSCAGPRGVIAPPVQAEIAISWYPILYQVPSHDLQGFRERLARGCFSASLADPHPIIARLNHRDANLLATTADGTLILDPDDRGILAQVRFPADSPRAAHLQVAIERGEPFAGSFGATVHGARWTKDTHGTIRELTRLWLTEVSLLWDCEPAFPQTRATVHVERRPATESARRRSYLERIKPTEETTWVS